MDIEAEKVNPYDDGRCKGEQVRDMFDSIAPAYDFMNRAMTMGIDKIWRRKAIRRIREMHPHRLLDVATGTGDLAILLARKIEHSQITGIDLSEGMVQIGRSKVRKARLQNRIELTIGDCLKLPFKDQEFDCVTVAYGVRNFQDLLAGYREMCRVLKPGGWLTVIELSTPTSPIIRPLYNIYTRHVIPLVGRLISRDSRAYSYLPESIAAVPQGEQMTDLMEVAGFRKASFVPMTFGTCTIYTAQR